MSCIYNVVLLVLSVLTTTTTNMSDDEYDSKHSTESKDLSNHNDLGMKYLTRSAREDIMNLESSIYLDAVSLSNHAIDDRDHWRILTPGSLTERIKQLERIASGAQGLARRLELIKGDVLDFRARVFDENLRLERRGFFGLHFTQEGQVYTVDFKGLPLRTEDGQLYLKQVRVVFGDVPLNNLDEGVLDLSSYVPISTFEYREIKTDHFGKRSNIVPDSFPEFDQEILDNFPKMLNQSPKPIHEILYQVSQLPPELFPLITDYIKLEFNGCASWDFPSQILTTNNELDLSLQKYLVAQAVNDHVDSFSNFLDRYHILFLHPRTEAYFDEYTKAKWGKKNSEESQPAKRIRLC
jgi:hypothetical protein